jgi:CDP-diglyceride synthetase
LGAIGFVSTFCLVFLGVIAVATRRGKPREFGSAAGVGAGLLCAAALNCLPWLMTAAGSERVALVIWTTWAGDGGASLIRLSHRPHRRVWEWASPGKTWAGVAVGAVFSAVFAMIFVWLFDLSTTCVDLVAILVLVPVLGPAGDLCESILKRLAGAKDSGGLFLLPGHGGVLDRTDSLVLTVPCILLTWRLLS